MCTATTVSPSSPETAGKIPDPESPPQPLPCWLEGAFWVMNYVGWKIPLTEPLPGA